MRKSIQYNYLLNLSYQILSVIVPFVTTPYLSRVLGVDQIGVASYTASIISYFVLVENLGTATYAQREIGYSQHDIQKRSKVFWEIILIRLYLFIGVTCAYLIFLSQVTQYKTIFLILTINLVNVLLDVTWFYQGMEEFQLTVFRNVIFKALNILLIFFVVKSPDDLSKYVFGTAILSTVCNISMWTYLKKYIVSFRKVKLKPFEHIPEVIRLFLPTVAIQVYTVLDKTMIGAITQSTAQNGYYEQADKVMKICLMLVASLGTVMIPRIANTFAQNDKDKVYFYISRSYRFVWFLSIPMILGLTAISDFFVPLFFGSGYEPVIVILPILSTLLLIIGLSNVTGYQYFVPTKQENKLTISVTVGAVVNLIFNALLIPKYAAIGAASSTIIAELTVTLTQFGFVWRTQELSKIRIFDGVIKYLISGTVMFLLLTVLKFFLSINVVSMSLLLIVGAGCYFVGLLILKDDIILSIFKKLFKKGLS